MSRFNPFQTAFSDTRKAENGELLESLDVFGLYAGFLLLHLPRIAAVSIYPLNQANSASRYKVLKNTVLQIKERPGLNLEFGVFNGNSLRLCSQIWPEGVFYGFDSFQGFPDDNRRDWNDDFAVKHLPQVPQNCRLVPGYFEDTLPPFLEKHKEPANFVNIDCDIYSSTRTVLSLLHQKQRLLPGTVLHFDELVNYREFCWNEMLALFQLSILHSVGFDWIMAHGPIRFAEEYVELIETDKFPKWGTDKQQGYRQQVTLVIRSQPLDLSILLLPHIKAKCLNLGARLKYLTQKHAEDKLKIFNEIRHEVGLQSTMQPV